MTNGAPGPVVVVLDEPGTPWVSVVVRCDRCDVVLASHRFDARTDAPEDGARRADRHLAAWAAHRCRGA